MFVAYPGVLLSRRRGARRRRVFTQRARKTAKSARTHPHYGATHTTAPTQRTRKHQTRTHTRTASRSHTQASACSENANLWKTALLEDGDANGWQKNSREIRNAPLEKAKLPRTWRVRLGAGSENLARLAGRTPRNSQQHVPEPQFSKCRRTGRRGFRRKARTAPRKAEHKV